MGKLLKSEIMSAEKECEALINRNQEYQLSGDLDEFFRCAITGKDCIGKIICDEDDQTSQFFSRAHTKIDMERIKNCPLYSIIDKEMIQKLILKRRDKETVEILNQL